MATKGGEHPRRSVGAAPSQTIAEAAAQAVRLQRDGRADEAKRMFVQILRHAPELDELWHRMGGAALAEGKHGAAVHFFRRALALSPQRAASSHNLGEANRLLRQVFAADQAYRHALRLRPAYTKAWCGTATNRQAANHPKAATRAFLRTLAVDPAFAPGWQGLSPLLHARGRTELVLRALRRAAILAPDDAPMRRTYGLALFEQRQEAEGVAQLRKAMALTPADPEQLGAYAGGLMREGRFDESLAATRRLRTLDPLSAEADASDSVLWMMRSDFARALAFGRRAAALKPELPAAWINLGLALSSLRRLEPSRISSERAQRLNPEDATAPFNLSMTLLATGALERGWPLYEARWRMPGTVLPDHAPQWDGAPLNGRSILLTAEQGQGDTLQFARYAPMVAERGGRVLLFVQPSLKRLLTGMPGVAAVHGYDEPVPETDVTVPFLSLPRLFGTTLDTIPAVLPYLGAKEDDRAAWRERLAGDRRLKVGLVWAGGDHKDQLGPHSVDRRRSLTLAALAPLATVEGVVFHSLQKGPPASQAGMPPAGMTLIDRTDELADFADTAAYAEQLDLVITVDTSVCHLVGGLGKPVWMLSRFDACWRWLEDREDSPWYPTMRLFRQTAPGDWDPVIARVAEELRALAARAPVERVSAGRVSAEGLLHRQEKAEHLPNRELA